MKDFKSLDQNALAMAISKIYFSSIFFPAACTDWSFADSYNENCWKCQTEGGDGPGTKRAVRELLWDVLMENFSPAMDLGNSLH